MLLKDPTIEYLMGKCWASWKKPSVKKSSQHLLTKYLTSKNHMTELKPQQAINHGFASFRQQLLTKYGGKVFS